MCTTATELQQKLPLKNELLRQLGCTNPLKRKKELTVSSIERLTNVLQPAISTSEVIDEWKLFQVTMSYQITTSKKELRSTGMQFSNYSLVMDN